MNNPSFFIRTAIALAVTAILVVVCYFYVDRPVAWFVHDHRFFSEEFMGWPSVISEWVKGVTVAGIALVLIWRYARPGGKLQTLLMAISVNLIATTIVKFILKATFGRYWPETVPNPYARLPSLIHSGDYGFHPFHVGAAYESFPSGHAAVIISVLAILWLTLPRWRWVCLLIGGFLCAALVGMNFHFVSDVIAGVVVGSIVGASIARWFRLSAG